ncbi:MAG TPA: sialidase family protein [Candidatus Hydrogenedentes bacterium]|nr:sialidase family protein [Candidatus Hydrogenedentota bacterium]
MHVTAYLRGTLSLLTLACFVACPAARGADVAAPPGIVISHSPQSTGKYIGSPSITVLPSGHYLAAHDYFGPESNEHVCATAVVFRSEDRGESWTRLAEMQCLFWPKLFTHRGAVYLLAVEKHHGAIVIRRSDDEGAHWTEPLDAHSGRLTPSEEQYHTAPGPVIEYKGRLWRAFEDAMGGIRWGERYQALMMSAPVDADLLNASSWTFSNPLPRDPLWLDGTFGGWLEGNAVVDPSGAIVNVLRVDTPGYPEKAALVTVSEDGSAVSFDPCSGFIDFPGGAKKFTIRHDPESGFYWTLSSIVQEQYVGTERPARIRNTLAPMRFPDLRQWEVRAIILHHPEVEHHGFQYVDWQFEGNNLIAVCRTAYDDDEGGARNNHDANFMTFHRIMDFRTLTTADPLCADRISDS